MPPLKLPKDSLLRLNGNRLSDHNRSELSVSVERIENAKRMADGTLRKYVVADKHTYSVSWEDLPHRAVHTVDGFWGGEDMEDFYLSEQNRGAITLTIIRGDGSEETRVVMITTFSSVIKKRGIYEFWDVTLEMEEV